MCLWLYKQQSYQRAKSNDLEDWFHKKECGKHNVEILQDFIIDQWCTMELKTRKKRENSRYKKSMCLNRNTNIWVVVSLQIKKSRLVPSSWGRWCWVRSGPWCCTQREATPQTATCDTGSSACSSACGESEVWRWWRNLYKLSVNGGEC